MRTKSQVYLLLALGACSPGVMIDAPKGALVVVGFEDRGSIAVELGRRAVERLNLDAEARAAVWFLDPDEFVSPDGSPLTDEALGQTEARVGPNACGCPNPRFEPAGKLTAHPGASCSIGRPPDSVYSRGESGVEPTGEIPVSVIDRIKLEWPGDCECLPVRTTSEPQKLVTCPLLPEGAPRTVRAAAITSEGTVAAVADRALILFGPNDERTEIELSTNEVVSHLAAVGHDFLFSSWDASDFDQASLHRLISRDGSVTDVTPTIGEGLAPRASLEGFGRVWLGGVTPADVAGYVTDVMSCESVGGRCWHHVISQREGCHWGGRSDGIRAFVRLGDELAAVSPVGGLATLDTVGLSSRSGFSCRLESHPAVGSESVRSIQGAAAVDGRLFLCAQLSNRAAACGAGQGAILEVDLSAESAALTITATRSEGCESIAELPNGEILASFGSTGVIISASGVRTVELGPAESGYFGEVGESLPHLHVAGDWVLSESEHSLLRGPVGGPLTAIYGRAPEGGTQIGAAKWQDRLVVARAGANVIALRPTGAVCSSIETTEIAGSSDLDPSVSVVQLTVATDDPTHYVLFGSKGSGVGFVRRGSFGDGFDEVELPFRPIDAAQLRDSRWIALGSNAILSLVVPSEGPIDPARFVAIEPEFDDPRTDTLERAPDVSPCEPRFKQLDSAQGVAWVTGLRSLVRLALQGETIHAEGYWFRDLDEIVANPMASGLPSPGAVDAECGADLSVAIELPANDSDPYPHAVFFQVRGRADDCSGRAVSSPHTLGTLCSLPDERSVFGRVSDVVALVPQRSGLAAVNSGGLVIRPPLNQRLSAAHSVRRATGSSGQTLFLWEPSGAVTAAVGPE